MCYHNNHVGIMQIVSSPDVTTQGPVVRERSVVIIYVTYFGEYLIVPYAITLSGLTVSLNVFVPLA